MATKSESRRIEQAFILLKTGVDGHKFILLIYFLTLEIIENSKTILPKELESLFNDFLEVEYYNKSEEDRMSLRKSAIKQASKMFKRLQELGYYK